MFSVWRETGVTTSKHRGGEVNWPYRLDYLFFPALQFLLCRVTRLPLFCERIYASSLHTIMFAKRSVPKDYSPTDTSDTETLLDKGESQEGERPLNSSPSVTSERNRGLRAYLHIAAIVFYSVITGLLYVWSVRINGSKCGCEDGMVYCTLMERYLQSPDENVMLILLVSSRKDSRGIREANNCP
jgi:hypothetical protein